MGKKYKKIEFSKYMDFYPWNEMSARAESICGVESVQKGPYRRKVVIHWPTYGSRQVENGVVAGQNRSKMVKNGFPQAEDWIILVNESLFLGNMVTSGHFQPHKSI